MHVVANSSGIGISPHTALFGVIVEVKDSQTGGMLSKLSAPPKFQSSGF